MIKLKLAGIVTFTLLQCFNIGAQSMTNSSSNIDVYEVYLLSKKTNSPKLDIEGSIYLFDEFKNGNITFTQNNNMENVPIRLDLLNNAIEVQKSKDIFVVSNLDKVESVEINKKNYVIRELEGKKIFFSVKKFDEVEILTRENVIFREGRKSTNSYSEDVMPSYEKERDAKYIRFGDSKLIELKSNRKFKNELKDSDLEELYKYYNKKNIKISREDDLKQLIEYYNVNI
ncbi:hypothetical protein [Marivirga sp.]|uniref:hypothetical protein n=1 Tax=Marivirga sp. TaxID=2018662 RepID=UPI0025F0AC61|nr:hypothetical protein [Marivirga sp.]